MSKQTIAIDIDDVLANSTDALRRVVNKRFGVNFSPEDYQIKGDYWQYYETVWQQNGLAGRISLAELEPMMVENQAHVFPHDNSADVLQELAKKYHLIIVTSRPASWRKATERWIAKHFPNTFNRILFTSEADKNKGQLCKEHGVGWLIDDNVEHAQSAVDQGLEVILFGDYGWHHTVPPHFHRCKDWPAVAEYFDARG